MDLYIYANPVQMLTFQMVDHDKILSNENCAFTEVVRTTSQYLKHEDIKRIVVVGGTVFADKVAEMITKNLNSPKVERA